MRQVTGASVMKADLWLAGGGGVETRVGFLLRTSTGWSTRWLLRVSLCSNSGLVASHSHSLMGVSGGHASLLTGGENSAVNPVAQFRSCFFGATHLQLFYIVQKVNIVAALTVTLLNCEQSLLTCQAHTGLPVPGVLPDRWRVWVSDLIGRKIYDDICRKHVFKFSWQD